MGTFWGLVTKLSRPTGAKERQVGEHLRQHHPEIWGLPATKLGVTQKLLPHRQGLLVVTLAKPMLN